MSTQTAQANIAMTSSGQPILILKEGSTQTTGREAQRNNISAAKLIAEIAKTSLGPRGMDKMLVSSFGDVTITNDGATIMKEMDIQHPAAKMMVEISKAIDNEVGDGTTSVVVLAGELLKKAEELIDRNIHPTIIIDGYQKAIEKVLEYYKNIGIKTNAKDKEMLQKVAIVSMITKVISEDSPYFANLVVDAVLHASEKVGDGYKIDIDDVKIEKKYGGSLRDTTLIQGIILDKEVVHSGMPKKVENAKIAIVDSALEIEKTELSAKINIESPDQMKAFLDEETNMLKAMVGKIKSSGANVLACQKGIDDMAQHFLAKEGILAVRRVKQSDMEKLAKASGGKVISAIESISTESLGFAKLVEERKIGDDKMVFVEGCKNPKSLTIFIRGGTERVIDEVERSIHDAICVVRDVVQKPYTVAGGGAPEVEVASRLRKWAETLLGKEQLAVLAFAEALESIPLTLAQNSGLDSIEILMELRARHEKGEIWAGIDGFEGKIKDMETINVYEPLVVKEQVLKSAGEVSCMILKIDDVISSGKTKGAPGGPRKSPGEESESEFD